MAVFVTNRSPEPVTVTVRGVHPRRGRVLTTDQEGLRPLPLEPTDDGVRFTAPAESWSALSS